VAVRILTRVPITSATADRTAQHAPLVAGAIGGVETLLVLDTGSDVHLLTKELVDRLGLTVEAGEEGVDHSGATMPSWSVEDAELILGDVEVTLGDLVSIPAPAPFTRWGIGGILSPQHLHPNAVTVIDLHHDELLLVDADDEELVSWLEARSPALNAVTLERDPSFPTLVVRGIAVRPFPEMPTLLNSGGKRTEFARDAVPGLGGSEPERLGGGVSGAAVIGEAAGAQVLDVAGHDLPVTELAVRETMHDAQGMVGIDVLRGTVLAFAGDRERPVVWQVSPAN
jgi:Aspartyl protease